MSTLTSALPSNTSAPTITPNSRRRPPPAPIRKMFWRTSPSTVSEKEQSASATTKSETDDERKQNQTLTICSVQPRLRSPETSPLDAAEHVANLIREAAATATATTATAANNKGSNTSSNSDDNGGGGDNNNKRPIDIFVLPELSPIGYSEDTFANFLPSTIGSSSIFGEIDEMFSRLAKELNCYICYGTIGTLVGGGECDGENSNDESRTRQEQYTIRQNVIDDNGDLLCYYDKMHLCDYGDCAETRFFVPGTKPCSFECRGFRIGILICADMRNPSLCRRLAAKPRACDLVLQPAAFSRDISFRTWRSFVETRAVENSVYLATSNYAGERYGNTAFVEPWVDEDHEPVTMGVEEGTVVNAIRRDVLTRARKDFPHYGQLMSEDWWQLEGSSEENVP